MHAFSSHAQIIIDIVPFVRYLIIDRPVINEALWSEQSFTSIWNHIKITIEIMSIVLMCVLEDKLHGVNSI